jgi:cAMP phosphodiesterase
MVDCTAMSGIEDTCLQKRPTTIGEQTATVLAIQQSESFDECIPMLVAGANESNRIIVATLAMRQSQRFAFGNNSQLELGPEEQGSSNSSIIKPKNVSSDS